MKIQLPFFLLCLCFLLLNCSNSPDDTINPPIEEGLYFPPVGSNAWESVSLDALGWNENNLQDLLTFLEDNNSESFIVLKDGKIAIEAYFNGGSSTDEHAWYSAGKTLSAFTVGLAQEEGFLNINNASALYLGVGWSSLTIEQEQNISIWNHITMTSGLDYTNILLQTCTLPGCLTFLNEPGTFWYYHNAPYTLSQLIVEGAVGSDFSSYFNSKLRNKIGMDGSWQNIGFNKIYHSSARSMARFGLLVLNDGSWDELLILSDSNYFNQMVTTSQNMNQAYGYLWWLNGKNSFRIPGSTEEFPGELIPNAPSDLIAGLGLNDQKLYVVPSMNLVITRMGDAAGDELAGPSSFDNLLWEKINAVIN